MKLLLLLRFALCASRAALTAADRSQWKAFERRDDTGCDIRHALHILESLSGTGDSFCTSLLSTSKGETKTLSETYTSIEICSVRTETTTEHGTLTTYTLDPTIYLPQLTRPSYSSTVFIPSGLSRPINKRTVSSPATPTPTALTACPPPTLSAACSSLFAPTTTTTLTASTTTHTKHSCLTTVTVTFTTTRHTITNTYPFTITPPPVFTPAPGVLTTTVPADCVSKPYIPSGGFPDGDLPGFPQYPDQPRSMVECCVVCHHTENCVAASYDPDASDCSFLINVNNTSPLGQSDVCPLGRMDFAFVKAPRGELGDILPGPCGM